MDRASPAPSIASQTAASTISSRRETSTQKLPVASSRVGAAGTVISKPGVKSTNPSLLPSGGPAGAKSSSAAISTPPTMASTRAVNSLSSKTSSAVGPTTTTTTTGSGKQSSTATSNSKRVPGAATSSSSITSSASISSVPTISAPPNIIKHGWVQKEDLKIQSSLFKPYTHKYFLLDIGTKTLKFASTPKVLQFPSQLKGFLTLTAEMKVSTFKKVIEKSLVVEIIDGEKRVRLRFIVDNVTDQEEWARSFRRVISECSVNTNTGTKTKEEIDDEDGGENEDDDVVDGNDINDLNDDFIEGNEANEEEELDSELETF